MLKMIISSLSAILCSVSLLFADNAVKLEYQSDEPLELMAVHSIEISQSVPGIKFTASGQQTFVSSIVLETEQKHQSVLQAPFDIVLSFKSLKIDLNVNQETITFDTRQPGASLLLAQLAKLMDRPIRLHIGKNLSVAKDNNSPEDLNKLLKELPILKEMEPQGILEGIIQPIFALSGRDLFPGSKIQLKGIKSNFGFPSNVIYEIESITDREVNANVTGAIEPQKIKLTGAMEVDEKKLDQIELSFSGNFTGKSSWNRENALLFKMNGEYLVNGLLKIADWEWPLSLSIKVEMGTRPFPKNQ